MIRLISTQARLQNPQIISDDLIRALGNVERQAGVYYGVKPSTQTGPWSKRKRLKCLHFVAPIRPEPPLWAKLQRRIKVGGGHVGCDGLGCDNYLQEL